MSIRYYKLFDLLNRKGMKKSDLRSIISSATVAKLSKGEYISGEAIEKICLFLNCQPGDIMEIVTVEELQETGDKIVKTKWLEKDLSGTFFTHESHELETKEGHTIILDDTISDINESTM